MCNLHAQPLVNTNKSDSINIPVLNAKLSLKKAKGCGFVSAMVADSFRYNNRDFRNIDGNKPKTVKLKFGNFEARLVVFEITNEELNPALSDSDRSDRIDQDDMFKATKIQYENYIRGCCNYCCEDINKKYWEGKDYLGHFSHYAWNALMGFDTEFTNEKFDEKINKNAFLIPVWENIKIDSLKGVKFCYVLKKTDCPVKTFSKSKTMRKIIPNRKTTGYSIVYLFKHPTNRKVLLEIGIMSTESKTIDESLLSAMMEKIEQFLAALVI